MIENKRLSTNFLNLLELFCLSRNIEIDYFISVYMDRDTILLEDWILIIKEIEKNTKYKDFYIEISEYIKPHHFGLLGYFCMSCNNLYEALISFIKYQEVEYSFNNFNIINFGTEIAIVLDQKRYSIEYYLIDEILISSLIKFIEKISLPKKIKPKKIFLASKKSNRIAGFKKYFNCHVEINHDRNYIFFDSSNLNIKLPNADKNLNSIIEKELDGYLLKSMTFISFEEKLEIAIIQCLNEGRVSIANVSKKLAISSRLLQLKLNKKGYTYKKKLNEIRGKMAIEYLKNHDLSILEISILLSYREQTSFIRAFNKWTGVSPLKYRKITEASYI